MNRTLATATLTAAIGLALGATDGFAQKTNDMGGKPMSKEQKMTMERMV